jgi:hypothetical protein
VNRGNGANARPQRNMPIFQVPRIAVGLCLVVSLAVERRMAGKSEWTENNQGKCMYRPSQW